MPNLNLLRKIKQTFTHSARIIHVPNFGLPEKKLWRVVGAFKVASDNGRDHNTEI